MLLFSKAAIVAAVGLCSLVLAPSAYAQNCPYVGQGTYSHNMSPTLTSPSAGQTFNVPYGSRADVQFQGTAKLTSSLDQIMSADCVRQAYKPQLLLQVDGIDTAFIDWDYATGKWTASAKIQPGQHKIRSKAVTYLKPTDPGVFYSSEISINVVQGQPPSTVIGTIDGVEIDTSPYGNGKAVLVGWACDRNVSRSIDVHVYLGGAAGQGTFGVVGNTNVLRPAVSATCGTSNVAHGFRIDLTTLQQQFAGKPIYVHGISTSGGYNPTLAASGQYNVPAVPALGIKGNVDGFSLVNGRLYLKGWACDRNVAQSVDVHLFAGGPAGLGTFIVSGRANIPREAAVGQACGTSGVAHGFNIDVTSFKAAFGGQPIYVHGISTSGGYNPFVSGSGIELPR